jgi:hypothetical protein
MKWAKGGAQQLWSVAIASTLVLTPYGNVGSLLEKRNPFHGFQSDDPVLAGIRIERETATENRAANFDCESNAVVALASGRKE